VPPFKGDPALSWHLIEQLVGEEFDLTTCQEMKVDHAFTLPMALLWPDQNWPVRVVPVCINTVQAPLPSATRCYKLGQALARAVASWPGNEKVVVLGTGGLSHQLDGERAGFINKDFDLKFMDSLVGDRPALGLPVRHPPTGGARRHPGRGTADVAGHARHAGRQGAGSAQQLPHPHQQHGLGPDAAAAGLTLGRARL
jgi:hypothetical protein